MKQITRILATLLVMFAFSAATFAQVQATANATATIVTPIAITKDVDLNFGNLAVSTAAGTAVVAPNGNRTATLGVTLMPGGTVSAASFTISGIADASYAVTLPTTLNIVNGANTMVVDNFTSDYAGTITGGSVVLNVGATVNVNINQPAAVYTNTTDLTVTVNYN